ncbi:MAG: SDR family oxidoreductase [Inquilinaceae bacterium]
MRLREKIAIVTGAGSGFGAGIARRFADEGARVVVADLDADAGRRVTGEIARHHPDSVRFVRADVSRDEDAAAMIADAVDGFGGLDILVNNAGFSHRNKPMETVTEEEFDRVFAVNVKAVFLATRHALPHLRARGGGVILNTASTAGLRPRPGLTWYNSSKGAVITASKSMATELAPDRIRVNALCPVIGDTGMTATFLGDDTPERRATFAATIPLGRFSTPDDMAAAALYLASDEAAFITGVALEVDGGRCV